ncbi:hypothetical protein FRB96_005511 [Tulasnella sp. 330]|nr:hypothetical protein FRB96_005511 [Tulasnella sp. 330]
MDWHDCVQHLFSNPGVIHIPNPSKSVGGGGYCDLFRGVYTRTGLELALKRPRFSTQAPREAEDTKRRFRREGEIWSTLLYHVNIVPFLGIVDIADETYLVSPWMKYGDLSTFVPERLRFLELSKEERLSHTNRDAFEKFDEWNIVINVIHGDIKAANVLLDAEIRPALCDFGLTKVLDGFSATSTAMKGAGSIRWTSPELLNGGPRSYQSDIFALGMTIAEIITGRLPLAEIVIPGAIILAIFQGQRPPTEPLSRNSKSFKDIWIVASSCWHPDPGQRPSAVSIAPARIASKSVIPTKKKQAVSTVTQATIAESVEQDSLVVDLPSRLPPQAIIPPTPEKDPRSNQTSKPRGSHTERPAAENPFNIFHNRHFVRDSQTRHWGLVPGPMITATSTDTSIEASSSHTAHGTVPNLTNTLSPPPARLEDAVRYEGIGDDHRVQGSYKDAREAYKKAFRAYRELGNRLSMADCLWGIGDVHRLQGRDADARELFERATRVYQELGDRLGTADCMLSVGHVHQAQDRYTEAREVYEVASQSYRELGDQVGLANCMWEIGNVHWVEHRYYKARESYSEAKGLYEELGLRAQAASCFRHIQDLSSHIASASQL